MYLNRDLLRELKKSLAALIIRWLIVGECALTVPPGFNYNEDEFDGLELWQSSKRDYAIAKKFPSSSYLISRHISLTDDVNRI